MDPQVSDDEGVAQRRDPDADLGSGGALVAASVPDSQLHISPPTSDDEDEAAAATAAHEHMMPRAPFLQDRRKLLLLLVVIAGYAAMLAVAAHQHLVMAGAYFLTRRRGSGRPGKRRRLAENINYFENLKSGPQHAFKAEFRLSREQFAALLTLIEPHHTHFGNLSVEKQLAMFLRWAGFGDHYNHLSNLFGAAVSTVSEIIHSMANSVIMALDHTIDLSLPEVRTFAMQEMQKEKRFHRFKNVIGAIDGTHIGVVPKYSASVPHKYYQSEAWRNRKGWLSTNVILICDLRGFIRFCIAGYEGCAHDQFIVSSVGLPRMLERGQGIVLGDVGFGNSDAVLAPYRNVRYHLAEFSTEDNAPRNPQELFNLRHSSLRVKIECAIGALKGTWQLLRHGLHCSPEFFATAIRSCVCLHNFLLAANPHTTIEDMVDQMRGAAIDHQVLDDDICDAVAGDPMADGPDSPDSRRDKMARKMWARYEQDLRSAVAADAVAADAAAAAQGGALQAAAATLRTNVAIPPPPPPQPAAQRLRTGASRDD